MLFISRLMTRLIHIPLQSSTGGSWDEIILLAVSFAVNALVFLPTMALANYSQGVINETANPYLKKTVAVIYAAIFIFVTIQSVSRFDYFATSSMSSRSGQVFFSVLLAAAACYAAIMGLSGLSRASCIIGFLMTISLIALSIALWEKYDPLAIAPPFSADISDLARGFVSSTFLMPEIAALAVLLAKTKGSIKKGFFIFLVITAITVCAVAFIPAAVFGQAVDTRLFSFYQSATVADFGSISRLDPLIVGLWIGGIFVKASLFLTAALISIESAFPDVNRVAFTVTTAVLIAIASTALSEDISLVSSPILAYIEQGLTVIGALIIPIAVLIFRDKGHRTINKTAGS